MLLYPQISGRAARVLLAIANRTYDRETAAGQPPGEWFGGEDELCWLAGIATSGVPPTSSQRHYLRRILADLVAAKALVKMAGPAPGRNARYRLNVDPNAHP